MGNMQAAQPPDIAAKRPPVLILMSCISVTTFHPSPPLPQVSVHTYTGGTNVQGTTLPDLVSALDLGGVWSGNSKVVIKYLRRSGETVSVGMCRTNFGNECTNNAPSAAGMLPDPEPGCNNDGVCDLNENKVSCPMDCDNTCGDGECAVYESPDSCPGDCAAAVVENSNCGDGICQAMLGEDCFNCPQGTQLYVRASANAGDIHSPVYHSPTSPIHA